MDEAETVTISDGVEDLLEYPRDVVRFQLHKLRLQQSVQVVTYVVEHKIEEICNRRNRTKKNTIYITLTQFSCLMLILFW